MQNMLEQVFIAAMVSLFCGPTCLEAGFPRFLPAFQPQVLWLALILSTPHILKIMTPLPTEPENNCYLEPQVQGIPASLHSPNNERSSFLRHDLVMHLLISLLYSYKSHPLVNSVAFPNYSSPDGFSVTIAYCTPNVAQTIEHQHCVLHCSMKAF